VPRARSSSSQPRVVCAVDDGDYFSRASDQSVVWHAVIFFELCCEQLRLRRVVWAICHAPERGRERKCVWGGGGTKARGGMRKAIWLYICAYPRTQTNTHTRRIHTHACVPGICQQPLRALLPRESPRHVFCSPALVLLHLPRECTLRVRRKSTEMSELLELSEFGF
jgi:hypothetical protein